jgi:signal transduction histidine kinase
MLEFIRSTYFQGLLDSFSAGVVIFNSEGFVYAVNKSACSILDLDFDYHVRRQWLELFTGLESKHTLEEMVNYVTQHMQQAPYHLTDRFSDSKGEQHYLTLMASPLIYHEKLFGIVLEINDVTNIFLLHEREKNILHERNILQQESYEGLRKMSMSVAHQIRNPITIIGGLAKRLSKELDLPAEKVGDFDTITSCVLRMENIVIAVSEYSAMNAGERKLTEVNNIIHKAREEALRRLLPPTVEIIWQINTEPYELYAAIDELSAGIAEIFLNAMESFVTSPGLVKVTGFLQNNHYRLEISDTGRGIAENNVPFIFDPFFTTKTVGVGMGLCKAQKAIKEHGGRIAASNAEGGGTTVSIEFGVNQ